jgi:hypothetical protein
MGTVGYQFLCESLGLNVFAPERPAIVKPVTRVEPTDGFLAIPRNVAPESGDPIEHILFALKHEGVDLQILAEVRIPRDREQCFHGMVNTDSTAT